MKITCMHCDSPFETTNVASKYLFCPWCGKRLLNPRHSGQTVANSTTHADIENQSMSATSKLFDDATEKNELTDIFGRPVDLSRLTPRKRTKIRLFIKQAKRGDNF